MRIIQLSDGRGGRRSGIVEDDRLVLLSSHHSTYSLATEAIGRQTNLAAVASDDRSDETLSYDEVYEGRANWRLLPAFDHPEDPAHCLVSGTGLTHKASAENRARMHQQAPTTVTDSMRVYQWGMEGGSPEPGRIGVQPEWFFKGHGDILRAHGEPLTVPAYGEDGGEEPEIAGAYLIGPDGVPYRVGFMAGNEFSDHVMERRNYLYLAPSKLRECAIGPELVTQLDFTSIQGSVAIEREGEVRWSAIIASGEKNMSHSVANLEHHQFKYGAHRRAGDVHIHFYGADAFSFGAGVKLEDGEMMVVSWPDLGRPLRNPIRIDERGEALVFVRSLA